MITARNKLGANDLDQIDESDEERELTNLNWLLRNQNLTWPKTIDANYEYDINTQPNSLYGELQLSTDDKINNTQKKQKLSECGSLKSMTNKYVTRNLVAFPESKKHSTSTTATTPSKRPSPAERYDIFINKIKRDLAEYEKSANKYTTDVTEKPPFNYSHIIGMAMLENGRVTLQQICAWIESKFAFFRVRKKWNNSIRHNLSLHHCFRNRKREEKGKGGYWELGVDPKKCDRKRIRNRKTAQSKLQSAKKHCVVTKDQFCQNAKSTVKKSESIENQAIISTNEKPIQICYRRLSQLADNDPNEHNVQLDLEEQSFTLTEVEVGLGLSLPNVLGPRVHNADNSFLCADEFATEDMSATNEGFHMQQQYELGTIIISTTGIIDDSTCLNSIINRKFGCTNMIHADDEISTPNENVIISSHVSTVLASTSSKIDVDKDANIALITPSASSPEIPSSLTINCDYSNFRPYLDSVDETFNYLHGSDINRNEDILDNLLDVCIRDY